MKAPPGGIGNARPGPAELGDCHVDVRWRLLFTVNRLFQESDRTGQGALGRDQEKVKLSPFADASAGQLKFKLWPIPALHGAN